MILNRIEYALMNIPLRAIPQRHFVAKRLLKMGGATGQGTALEIGCGRGIGVEIILDLFGAAHVDAFDLDPRMIALANNRLERRIDQVRIWQGDATLIEAADNSYNAVFDFGIIHHVPEWREALAEAYRVIKPNGRFYVEEVFSRVITHRCLRSVLRHPQEDRFNREQFCQALEDAGFKNINSGEMLGLYGWFVAEKPEV